MRSVLREVIEKFFQYRFDVSEKSEDFLLIKSQSGKEYQIDLRVLNLSQPRRDKTIKIPKSDWNYELPDNLYVAYVVVFGEEEKDIFTHLIPSSVFQSPDKQIFFENSMEERFKHLANWEIKFFKNVIERLSKYAFDRVVGEFLVLS